MGDDTLLLLEKETVLESDFSRYDRTQNKELRKLVDDVLRPHFPNLVEDRENMYKRELTMGIRKLRKKLPKIVDKNKNKVDMRYTGEPATCLDNSIINAVTTAVALEDYVDRNIPFADTYDQFGLTAKTVIRDLKGSTFLKGVFLQDKEGYYMWVRLPSFLLKFGKTLTDYRNTYKRSLNESARMALHSQWSGYGDMRTNWFYTRFHNLMVKLTGTLKIKETDDLEQWQVVSSGGYIEDDEWNAFMLSRYRITVDEMEMFLVALETVSWDQLPVKYHNRLLLKLEVDY